MRYLLLIFFMTFLLIMPGQYEQKLQQDFALIITPGEVIEEDACGKTIMKNVFIPEKSHLRQPMVMAGQTVKIARSKSLKKLSEFTLLPFVPPDII